MVGGQRDGAQRFLADAVVVHVALHAHRKALRRRDHAIGRQVGALAADRGCRRARARGLPEAAVLALRERAEHHDAVGLPGRNRGRAIGDRRAAAAATAAPLHGRRAQARQPERDSEPGGVAAVVTVRGEAIDSVWMDAGVGASGQDGLERELELRVG